MKVLKQTFSELEQTVANVIISEVGKRVKETRNENLQLKGELDVKNKKLEELEETFEDLKNSNWVDYLKKHLETVDKGGEYQ